MVGDLPLKRENYFFDAFDSAHADADGELARLFQYVEHQRAAKCLENLQILLHLKGQEECEIVLDGRSHRNEQTPFHEEILANWEQFARVVGENNQLEDLVISDIVLPPAPFFADMMAPSLQKSSLLRLDLINCNLTSSEFESVAQLLRKKSPFSFHSVSHGMRLVISLMQRCYQLLWPSTKYSPLLTYPSVG